MDDQPETIVKMVLAKLALPRHADIDAVAQEIRLFVHFHPELKGGLLTTAARCRAIDYLRETDHFTRKQRRDRRQAGLPQNAHCEIDNEIIQIADSDRLPDDKADTYDFIETVLKPAIRQLSQKRQQVIRGLFLEGHSQYYMSKHMGNTISNVSSLKNEALKELREIISNQKL